MVVVDDNAIQVQHARMIQGCKHVGLSPEVGTVALHLAGLQGGYTKFSAIFIHQAHWRAGCGRVLCQLDDNTGKACTGVFQGCIPAQKPCRYSCMSLVMTLPHHLIFSKSTDKCIATGYTDPQVRRLAGRLALEHQGPEHQGQQGRD